MSDLQVDAGISERIAALGKRVLDGGQVDRAEAEWLFELDGQPDLVDLMAWANRLRERFKGNKVHLCSIVNAKAGGCPEDCKFCAQSVHFTTAAPRYDFIDSGPVLAAAEEAQANGVTGLGIVAAWKGLNEGPVLEAVCARIAELARSGKVRADASLGLIKSQRVADRLREAGCECYNHNLETSRRFFPRICSTHSYEDRLETLRHVRQAGLRICSGGIIGLGETRQDRCDLAFALREIEADFVPLNFLNPIPGTPLAEVPPLPPMEILQTIACFRFLLPRQELMIAGGRSVNLRSLQGLVFLAGASAMMVGNYLTTVNEPVEKDLQMLKDLGMDPRWEHPESWDRHEPALAAATR